MLFLHKDTKTFDWKNLDNYKGKVLGLTLGEKPTGIFADAVESAGLKIDANANSIESNFKKLFLKRIDMIAANYDTGMEILNTLFSAEERKKLKVHPKPIRISLYRLLISKKHKNSMEILSKFNEGLYQLRKSGRIKAMLEASQRGEYEK